MASEDFLEEGALESDEEICEPTTGEVVVIAELKGAHAVSPNCAGESGASKAGQMQEMVPAGKDMENKIPENSSLDVDEGRLEGDTGYESQNFGVHRTVDRLSARSEQLEDINNDTKDDQKEGTSVVDEAAADDGHCAHTPHGRPGHRRKLAGQHFDGGTSQDEHGNIRTHVHDVYAGLHRKLPAEGQEREQQVLLAQMESTRAYNRHLSQTGPDRDVETYQDAAQNPQYEQVYIEFVGERAQDVVSVVILKLSVCFVRILRAWTMRRANGLVIRPVGTSMPHVLPDATGAGDHRCALEQYAFRTAEAVLRWFWHHAFKRQVRRKSAIESNFGYQCGIRHETDCQCVTHIKHFSGLSRPLAVNHVLVQLDLSHNEMDCLATALLGRTIQT